MLRNYISLSPGPTLHSYFSESLVRSVQNNTYGPNYTIVGKIYNITVIILNFRIGKIF